MDKTAHARRGRLPETMRAMVLEAPGAPLREAELPRPRPAAGEVLLRVEACGVCRTDLHIADGELPPPLLPLAPGHEIVGRVAAAGKGAAFAPGARLGVPWLGRSCGACEYCREERENLCDAPSFTGYHAHGGYAQFALARADFCFSLPEDAAAAALAPLLCAGLIGYRCLRMAGAARRLGIYGFGAAAHILVQVALAEEREIYAFTRAGDRQAQDFARGLGAAWAGGSEEPPPCPLDAAILFAPVGALLPKALAAVRKGGVVVCGGIHMSDIPSFPYALLWQERCVRSVANLTRKDGREFLALASRIGIATETRGYPLAEANAALADLRAGRLSGAAVLLPED